MNEIERVIDVALKPLRLAPGCVPAYDEARENLVKMVDSLVESAYVVGVAAERERLEPLVSASKALLELVMERHCITSAEEFTCPRMRALWEATKLALLVGDRDPSKKEIAYGMTLENEAAAIRAAGVEAERERCAGIARDWDWRKSGDNTNEHIADAIEAGDD